MTWYAAHIVMLVRFKGSRQRRVPAWENVVLLEAADDEEAIAKAEAIGQAESLQGDGSARWGGRPFVWEFAGVRRVCSCAVMGKQPASGDEITYSELEFESRAAAQRYANGRPVTVRHRDQIRPLDDQELGEVSKPKRKRA